MKIERLDGFTSDGFGNVIAGDPVDGDVVRIDGRIERRYSTPVAVVEGPKTLSKTSFQDYAVSQLGTGLTGMARFQAIMDACAVGTGAIKFCFSRYEAADTFAKDKVDQFTQIMVGASIMTADERTAILANWPVV